MQLNKPYKTDLCKEDWLAIRKEFITATEASILMGVNPYNTPSQLLKDKLEAPAELFSKFLDRGLENETEVLKTAAEWVGGTLVESQGFYANPTTRISATPDAILADGRLIEAKCTGIKNLGRWSEYPPVYYIMQCQVQMYVTGARENYLHARFFYNWPESDCEPGADRMYKIEYSEEIMNICIDKVALFWHSLKEGTQMRRTKAESELHDQMLKATCKPFKGHIIMEKFEIEPSQLSIIRQTCLKASAKICVNLPATAVMEFAELIENEIFIEIAKGCGDNSRNFLIQIGAAVNGYAEGSQLKTHAIADIKAFVVHALRYITRK